MHKQAYRFYNETHKTLAKFAKRDRRVRRRWLTSTT
jgi:hypothetical protein